MMICHNLKKYCKKEAQTRMRANWATKLTTNQMKKACKTGTENFFLKKTHGIQKQNNQRKKIVINKKIKKRNQTKNKKSS